MGVTIGGKRPRKPGEQTGCACLSRPTTASRKSFFFDFRVHRSHSPPAALHEQLIALSEKWVGLRHIERHIDDMRFGRPKVGELNDSRNLQAAVVYVYPEVWRYTPAELQKHTDDRDIDFGFKAPSIGGRKIRNYFGYVRRRNGGYYVIDIKALSRCGDAHHFSAFDLHMLDRTAAEYLPAEGGRLSYQGVNENLGATIDVAKFFLKNRSTRGRQALDSDAEPRRGHRVRKFVELQIEASLPQKIPVPFAGSRHDQSRTLVSSSVLQSLRLDALNTCNA